MFAIASLLDTASDQNTRDLWQFLMGQCGLFGIFTTPTPHISWQVADQYSDHTVAQLERFSKLVDPISVPVSGLGIFAGEKPIVYLSLVKTPRLMEIHHLIWTILTGYGTNLNRYYSSEQWVPHITLAYRDTSPENMMCALEGLAFKPLETRIVIDNLALIYSTEAGNGMTARFPLRNVRIS